jgi:predicted Zn-dependent protease
MRRLIPAGLAVLALFAIGILAWYGIDEDPSFDATVQVTTEMSRGISRTLQEHVVVTPAMERSVGEKIRDSLRPGLRSDPYVSRVGNDLASQLAGSPYTWEFHVVPMAQPNAFAVPGGILFVTSGLLSTVKYEAELACVLGHEIMHVERGHLRDAMKSLVAADRLGADPAALLQEFLRTGYSQAQETEADRDGIELAAITGYAPLAANILFDRLSGPVGGGNDDLLRRAVERYLASHPPARERKETVSQIIRDKKAGWIGRRFYWGKENLRKRIPLSKLSREGEWRTLEEAP